MKRFRLKLGAKKIALLSSALVMVPSSSLLAAEVPWTPAPHVFSINDVQGKFADGLTFEDNNAILCGHTASAESCPTGSGDVVLPAIESYTLPLPYPDDETNVNVDVYPINSEFGFKVSDFVGAAPKAFDDKIDNGSGTLVTYYGEGWAGNIESAGDGSEVVGVAVSNASTDFFKVKPPMGTWCGGLGATSVKCSTEHYTVLEHVKTCYETIPYMFYDFDNNDQGILIDPATGLPVAGLADNTCSIGKLSNVLYKVINGSVSGELLIPGDDGFPNLPANESTVLNDIAVNTDYAITKKDDGKPLYRWGDLIKRPNDVRLYTSIPLPEAWKAEGANYQVTAATLTITHTITNNPNDQIRPEDMENEGATGTLPAITESAESETWTSAKDCYEGDGHYIPAGTILKNGSFKLDDTDTDPYAYSSDLTQGLTNAWYTTTDRDPFATDPVSGIGPRWRLLPNKFGQDIPGLEIPLAECSPVPFSSGNIRYETGEQASVPPYSPTGGVAPTGTVINLLDFANDASPLRYSSAWVNNAANFQNLCPEVGDDAPVSGVCEVSVNGSPMTDDFDLVLYIKGDKKPVAVYNATLELTYDDTLIGSIVDLTLDEVIAPSVADAGQVVTVRAVITNNGTVEADGLVDLYGAIWSPTGWVTVSPLQKYRFTPIAPGATTEVLADRVIPDVKDGKKLHWFTSVYPYGGDDDNTDNWGYAITIVNNPPL